MSPTSGLSGDGARDFDWAVTFDATPGFKGVPDYALLGWAERIIDRYFDRHAGRIGIATRDQQ